MGPKKQDLKVSSSKGGNKSSKPTKKSKKNDSDDDKEDDEDDDENEDDEDDNQAKSKRKSINTKRKRVVEEANDEEDEEDEDGSEKDSDNESNDDKDSDDEEGDEEEEEPPKKLSKGASDKKVITKKAAKPTKKDDKAAAKKKADKKKADKKKADDKRRNGSDPKAAKKMSKIERLEEARKAFKWWEAPELDDGVNWKKLEHAGIAFAPPYVRHNIPMKYDGKILLLTMEQEEMASSYASLPHDGPQLGIPKTRVVFQKNFFKDFQQLFPTGNTMKKFDLCDFSVIKEHLDLHKSLKKAATLEEKAVVKGQKEVLALQHGYCLIDGRMERVGNYNMEPPGLFRGRGEHPKTGMAKSRTYPESCNINMSADSVPPVCLLPGHAWENIRHDPDVTWLAKWDENVLGSTKYVMLSASSSFKGKSDTDKYQNAMRLKDCIHRVRKDYTTKIKSTDKGDRQLGVAMWLIDILALRVGGEKGEGEADTVGCCSLRKEHLSFNPEEGSFEMELEFLGKDSMLYKQNINFAQYEDLGKLVHKRLKTFCAGKESTQQIFDEVEPFSLNKHLASLMKGLTAKVFRTYNASITLEKELPDASLLRNMTIPEKLGMYNAANRQVAILCNHQKTVSKAAEQNLESLNEKIVTMNEQKDSLIKWKVLVAKGKLKDIPLKEDDKGRIEELSASLKAAIEAKENAKTNDDKIASTAAIENARAAIKLDQGRRFLEKHMFSKGLTPTVLLIQKKIETWTDSIRKLEIDIRNRDENKEVSLGTSKINYMDPRISVAWCKRCEVPIDKVFAKTLRDKFNWAMAVPPDWKFEFVQTNERN